MSNPDATTRPPYSGGRVVPVGHLGKRPATTARSAYEASGLQFRCRAGGTGTRFASSPLRSGWYTRTAPAPAVAAHSQMVGLDRQVRFPSAVPSIANAA